MAGEADVKAGGAFVEIWANMTRLDKGLASAEQRLQQFGKYITSISLRMLGAGVGILGSLFATTRNFAAAGSDLAHMSTRTGVAVEVLSQLQFSLEQSGARLGDFESALDALNGALREAMGGNVDLMLSFSRLGVNVRELIHMDAASRFLTVAQALLRIQGPANRAAVAMQVFGGAGRSLLPFLSQGADAIEAMREQASRMGVVMSTENAQAAVALQAAMSRLMSIIRGVGVSIGSALAPTVLRAIEVLSGASTATLQFIQANQGMVVAAAGVGVLVVSLGVLGLALGTAMTAFGAFVKLGALWFSTSAVMGRNIGSLAYYFRNDLADGMSVSQRGVQAWANEVQNSFQAVVAYVSAGDINSAMRVITLQLRVTWQEFISWLQTAWGNLTTGLAHAINDSLSDIQISITRTRNSMAEWFARQGIGGAPAGMFLLGGGAEGANRRDEEEINRRRNQMRTQLDQMQRQQSRAERDRLEADLQAARDELNRMRDEALWTEALRSGPSTGGPGQGAGSRPPTPDDLMAMRLQVTSAGTFSGASLSDLTAARADQTQLNLLRQQLSALTQIAGNTREGGPRFA